MITYDARDDLTIPLMVGTAKYTYPIPDNYNIHLLHQDFVVRAEYFRDPVLGSGLPNGGGHLAQQTNVRTLKGGLVRYTNIYAFNFKSYRKVTEQSDSVSYPAFKADHFTYKEHYRLGWKPHRAIQTDPQGRAYYADFLTQKSEETMSEYRGGKQMIFRDAFTLLVPVEVTETIETNSVSQSSTNGEIGDLPDHEVPVGNPKIGPDLLKRLKEKYAEKDAKYKFGEPLAGTYYNWLNDKFEVFIDLEKQLTIKLEQYAEENKVSVETFKTEKGIKLQTDLSVDFRKLALSSYSRQTFGVDGKGGLAPANFSATKRYNETPSFVRYIGTDFAELIDKYGVGNVKVNYVSHLTTPTFDQYKSQIGKQTMIPFPEERTQLFGDLYLVKRFRCSFR